MQQAAPQEAHEGQICCTPNLFKEKPTADGQERLTSNQRFRRGRSHRRWRVRDPLSARRYLFPEERRHSSGEESDESGYSYGSFLEDCSDQSDDDAGDQTERNSRGRQNGTSCASGGDRDRSARGDCEGTSGFKQLQQDDDYTLGITLRCKEKTPRRAIDYPYADDGQVGTEVAYEVEVFTDE